MQKGPYGDNPLIRRARQLEEAAENERARERDALRRSVEAFVSDPDSWREYMRTLALYPRRAPEEIVELTRYRLSLGLDRMPQIMEEEEVRALGLAPREGSAGVELASTRAVGPSSGKTRFYAVEDTVPISRGRPAATAARDRRVDTSDSRAMDAFAVAAGTCDLGSLTQQAEYAVSVCYGLDFDDDPVPSPPPAETAAELYDALARIGRSVADVQRGIDAALSAQYRTRREMKKGSRPPRGGLDAAQRKRDPKVIGAKETAEKAAPKAPTRDELCAMSAADVARAARGARRMGRA